jgi:hypothetical protein
MMEIPVKMEGVVHSLQVWVLDINVKTAMLVIRESIVQILLIIV